MSSITEQCVRQIAWLEGERDAMLQDLLDLASINSGSYHLAGLARTLEALQGLFAPLQGEVSRLALPALATVDDDGRPLSRPLGQALRIRTRPEAPLQLLLVGHMDTVFGAEHPFQTCRELAGGRINGPGVADLKGGLVVMQRALLALEHSPWADRVGWEVLINPDEEIGSPGSAPLLAEAAARHHLGLIYEPAYADGSLAGARKGSGNFTVVCRGRAAHAGREHHLGRNAVVAAAAWACGLDALNGRRAGVTFNAGRLVGGGAVNVVPDTAVCRFNVRVAEVEDIAWVESGLRALQAQIAARDGIELALHGGFGRPPKPLSGLHRPLFEAVRECASAIGLSLSWQASGGCCDGNNLAAAGLPNVDTLGVVGGAIHSADEYVEVSSLTERARLSALLLLRLASGDLALSALRADAGAQPC